MLNNIGWVTSQNTSFTNILCVINLCENHVIMDLIISYVNPKQLFTGIIHKNQSNQSFPQTSFIPSSSGSLYYKKDEFSQGS